jgi:EF-hand domain-containing protein 1
MFSVYRFQLMKADEFTINYMKGKPEVFKEADVSQVLVRLRKFADKYSSFDAFLVDLVK